ncbi:MAG: beta-ketoacyl-ACP synthase III [SAR86 cluster bacterium]|jgi:beta-ketodecanoyl-[acyl-carrier-protein] synthase|nr:beta-ketoacyl-ACP synthase III [SAR86 cluster bacterium]|tara:strand:- start:1444 stop:2562 length:1119 start_codon:yes stop_codon:yes gene_type:complete
MTVVVSGTGLYTPPEVISNKELVQSFNKYVDKYNLENHELIEKETIKALTYSDEAFIKKVSGIERRHVINKSGILDPLRLKPSIEKRKNEEPSVQAEIAFFAAKEALKESGKKAEDIDAVICACANLQRAYPAIAIEVQDLLGIEGYAYDMNVACSSSTFALQNAINDIRAGVADVVLVVNPEICSGHLNFADKDGHFIFGDVCTALIIEKDRTCNSDIAFEVIDTKLKTVFSNNIRNNFGFLNSSENNDPNDPDKLFIQQGKKVFKEVVPMVAELIASHLEKNNILTDEVSRLWLHQANVNMNLLIAKRLLGREPQDKELPIVLNDYANTSSAGSIIAHHNYKDDLKSGELGVICSFGAGYSAGSIILKKV